MAGKGQSPPKPKKGMLLIVIGGKPPKLTKAAKAKK
jgi:hypothetical protein